MTDAMLEARRFANAVARHSEKIPPTVPIRCRPLSGNDLARGRVSLLADPGPLLWLHGQLGRTLTEAMAGSPFLAPSRLWAVGTARVDRAARGAEGLIGAAIGVPHKWVSFFTRPPPPCLLQRFQRRRLKPAAPPRLTAAVSSIPNAKMLTDYERRCAVVSACA